MSERLTPEREKIIREFGRAIDGDTPMLLAEIDALRDGLRHALYLLGSDADRARIGEKPWGERGAHRVKVVVREALWPESSATE